MAAERKRIWIALGLVGTVCLAVVIGAMLFGGKPPPDLKDAGANALSPPLEIPQFSLIDQQGQPFNNDRLRGNWTVAFIGFTYCPDVCPTALAKMAEALNRLKATPSDNKPPVFLFISVDPFRDTPEILDNYVKYFNKSFIGLTGAPEHISKLVSGLGLYYVYTDPDDDHFLDDVLHKPTKEDYGVVHSSRVLFISPRAQLVAMLPQPFEADDILKVIKKLRSYYGG